MSRVAVAGTALVVAGALGILLSWSTRADGAPDDLAVQVRTAIGGLSTPWLLIPFLAGALCLGVRAGALLGTACSLAAVAGWYVMTSGAPDLTGSGVLDEVRRGLSDKAFYLLAALVLAPLMGAFGAWWRRARSLSPAVVAGLLLVLEPLAMWGLSWLDRHDVLPDGGLPLGLDRLLLSYGARTGVLVGELVLGIAVVYLFARRSKPVGSASAA